MDITDAYFHNGLHGDTYENSGCHNANERILKQCALRYGFQASRRVLLATVCLWYNHDCVCVCVCVCVSPNDF